MQKFVHDFTSDLNPPGRRNHQANSRKSEPRGDPEDAKAQQAASLAAESGGPLDAAAAVLRAVTWELGEGNVGPTEC